MRMLAGGVEADLFRALDLHDAGIMHDDVDGAVFKAADGFDDLLLGLFFGGGHDSLPYFLGLRGLEVSMLATERVSRTEEMAFLTSIMA